MNYFACSFAIFKERQSVSNEGTAGGLLVFGCLGGGNIMQFFPIPRPLKAADLEKSWNLL